MNLGSEPVTSLHPHDEADPVAERGNRNNRHGLSRIDGMVDYGIVDPVCCGQRFLSGGASEGKRASCAVPWV